MCKTWPERAREENMWSVQNEKGYSLESKNVLMNFLSICKLNNDVSCVHLELLL